jgi:hypothetical protein
MEPPVVMDTTPDYLQFAAQCPGFPVGVLIAAAAAVHIGPAFR